MKRYTYALKHARVPFMITVVLLVCAVIVVPMIPVHATAQQTTSVETASSTNSFVNIMSVDTHYNYNNLVYGNTQLIKSLLGGLGIQHIRDGSDRQYVWDDWYNDLYTPYGITVVANFTPASYWTLSDMLNLLKSHPPMVYGAEGANEPDAFGISYNGQTGYPATISFQNDLYNAIKGDSVTNHMPVLAPPMAFPEDAANLAPLSSINYETMHSYPGGALPNDQLDTRWIPDTNKMVGSGNPTKPIWVTETGYHTAVNCSGCSQPGVSELAQSKYLPRLFGEYFNRGIQLASIYELIDEGTDTTNQEQNWGIVRNNGTPKPAYTAMKNLISLLKEPATNFTPGGLDYSISQAPSTVHHTLLQKSNGDFYLLLWNNVSVYNTTTKQDISNQSVPVTLNFTTGINKATTYTFDNSGNTSSSTKTVSNNQLTVNVSDSMTVVQLSNRRNFATGLESGDPQPTWTNTVDVNGGNSYNVSGICCGLSGPETGTRTEVAHTGSNALMYSGYATTTSAPHFAYLKVFDVSSQAITVGSTTTLSYWIFPESQATNGIVTGGNDSTCVAIDMIFNSGWTLRDSNTTDQNGNRIHPAYQCGHLTLDSWNYVQVNLGTYLSGQTINHINVGFDNGPYVGGYRGYIDDISITS